MRVLASKLDRINQHSRMPKYRQVINTILDDISNHVFKPGERIPSINETSEEYYLSRDTVEKAYKELSRRGIISSVPGKGYYVNSTDSVGKIRIIAIFNKLSDYKKIVYNTFVKTLGNNAYVTLFTHQYNIKQFEHLVYDNLGQYDYFVIMPHFYEEIERAKTVIQKIPKSKLILLDKSIEDLDGNYGMIYQDFQQDIVFGLESGYHLLEKYEHLYLAFPAFTRYPEEIKYGFTTFCKKHGISHSIIPEVFPEDVNEKEGYIVLQENDLINLVKTARNKSLKLGKDIGILSYNDTPIKEILSGGITVLTTDHAQMGVKAAEMVLDKTHDHIKNPFKMIKRASL